MASPDRLFTRRQILQAAVLLPVAGLLLPKETQKTTEQLWPTAIGFKEELIPPDLFKNVPSRLAMFFGKNGGLILSQEDRFEEGRTIHYINAIPFSKQDGQFIFQRPQEVDANVAGKANPSAQGDGVEIIGYIGIGVQDDEGVSFKIAKGVQGTWINLPDLEIGRISMDGDLDIAINGSTVTLVLPRSQTYVGLSDKENLFADIVVAQFDLNSSQWISQGRIETTLGNPQDAQAKIEGAHLYYFDSETALRKRLNHRVIGKQQISNVNLTTDNVTDYKAHGEIFAFEDGNGWNYRRWNGNKLLTVTPQTEINNLEAVFDFSIKTDRGKDTSLTLLVGNNSLGKRIYTFGSGEIWTNREFTPELDTIHTALVSTDEIGFLGEHQGKALVVTGKPLFNQKSAGSSR